MGVQVTFLGAGDAFNAGSRCHSSYLVAAPSAHLLLDCGSTILLAMRRAGVSQADIDAIFISHMHGDHFAGLPFLFLAWIYDTPRRRPLTLVGPPGIQQRVQDTYRAMYRDLAARPLPFALDCIEVNNGMSVQVGPFDLRPFRVPHQETEISLGLRLSVDGRVILYSGDTGWTEELVAQSQQTDLFICECCFYETRVTFHLDYPRIAANHDRFGCQRLVLTHLGREVLARRNDIHLELAYDGLVVEL